MKWLFCLLLLQSCGTVGYLTRQGWGQLKLQMQGTPNEEVLADSKVSDEIKQKIRLIEKAKKFFNDYFEHDSKGIYSKVIFLEQEAITWLVIASQATEIKAHEHEFPLFGSFPYLGFFDREDAQGFAQKLNADGLVTWVRPVSAYSTLGYFEDRILSSFFQFDEVELAELVFHELFHSLFFIKDNVELNENLATLFADLLLDEYYQQDPKLAKFRQSQKSRKELEDKLVQLAQELKLEFEKMRPYLSREKADAHMKQFVEELLIPVVQPTCALNGWQGDDCPDKVERWNQARFAALLTYESEQDFLRSLYQRRQLGPREFLLALKGWHIDWKNGDKKDDFATFLSKR